MYKHKQRRKLQSKADIGAEYDGLIITVVAIVVALLMYYI